MRVRNLVELLVFINVENSNRNASFLKKGGNDLLQWLQLDTNKISKAVIECLSFITYDR